MSDIIYTIKEIGAAGEIFFGYNVNIYAWNINIVYMEGKLLGPP